MSINLFGDKNALVCAQHTLAFLPFDIDLVTIDPNLVQKKN